MGYAVGEACYSDLPAALSAAAQRVVSSTVTIDGHAFFLVVSPNVGNTQLLYLYRSLQVGVPDVRKLVSPVLPSCELVTYQDALLLSWAVALVWFSAYSFKFIARGLHV